MKRVKKLLQCYIERIEEEEDFIDDDDKLGSTSLVVLDKSNFVVSGEKGAIVFAFNTFMLDGRMMKFFEITVHSLRSNGGYNEIEEESCSYLHGKTCYSVQSEELATRIVERLKNKNQFDENHLFGELGRLYHNLFQ